MKMLMEEVHQGQKAATLDANLLPFKPLLNVEAFESGQMLDDTCLDWMLECLVKALGSRMLGVKGEKLSPLLRIDQPDLASRYYVIGVAQAELLRGAVRRQRRDTTAPGTVEHADCQSWTELGDSEDCDAALRRFLSGLVGAENVDEALDHKLDPFDNRNILVMATWRKHTILVELQRSEAMRWNVSTHYSGAASHWDDDLLGGMSRLLEMTGLKISGTNFIYKYPQSVKQKGAVECGYMGLST
jgi:hypothetical protein